MTEIKMPPLPEPENRLLFHSPLFTADQLRARDLAVAQAVIEACALACDGIENGKWPDGVVAAGLAWECADAIRAIKIEGETR